MVKSYSVIKTEIMSLAAIWKELEVIVQWNKAHTERQMPHDLSHLWKLRCHSQGRVENGGNDTGRGWGRRYVDIWWGTRVQVQVERGISFPKHSKTTIGYTAYAMFQNNCQSMKLLTCKMIHLWRNGSTYWPDLIWTHCISVPN
jgi:hypothetical protein